MKYGIWVTVAPEERAKIDRTRYVAGDDGWMYHDDNTGAPLLFDTEDAAKEAISRAPTLVAGARRSMEARAYR